MTEKRLVGREVVPETLDDLLKSVVLITGTGSRSFGTGFAIHAELDATWILTCAHVVEDVGGIDNVRVENKPAESLACGKSEEVDLAVLKVEGLILPSLKLERTDRRNIACVIVGFAELAGELKKAEPLEGRLGNNVVMQAPQGPRVKAWKLWIEGRTLLAHGYSGSPVICNDTATVVAVASHREYQGERGYAVSLANLQDIWPELPPHLLDTPLQTRGTSARDQDQLIDSTARRIGSTNMQATPAPAPDRTENSPALTPKLALPGPLKVRLCQRLGRSWADLAMYLEIPADHQRRFTPGREGQDILTWLEERGRLAELPEALEGIDRKDLAELLAPSTTPGPSDIRPSFRDEQTRTLSESLEAAYQRREELLIAGQDTKAVQDEILSLRRQIREGGQLRPGYFLLDGRFRLIEPLGRGGFATIWKGIDRQNHNLVAIKVLHGQYVEDRTRRERFFRGARHMAMLQHQGIVRVHEKELWDESYHFFVMEFLEGGDFRTGASRHHHSRGRSAPVRSRARRHSP